MPHQGIKQNSSTNPGERFITCVEMFYGPVITTPLCSQMGDEWLERVLSDVWRGRAVSYRALLEDAVSWVRLLCLRFALSVT